MDERLLKAAMSGNSSDMKHLVFQDPRVLLGTTPQGSTCLHISSMFGHEEFSKAVLALNRSLLSSINLSGETPLLVAVTNGHVSLASAMLKQDQQLNLSEMILKQDKNGDNALHHAIRNGHSDVALELLAVEPRLSQAVNKYKESPMYIAVLRGFSDVFERLLEIPLSNHGGPINENALHAAVRNEAPGIAKKILDARPSLAREENKAGNTPMQIGVLWNRLDMIRVFLKHDCSLGYLVSSKTAAPLLLLAAHRGNVAVAQEILNYCPDAPCCTLDGRTMLHTAVSEGHEHFVEFILENPQLHKLINMRDKDGNTALHIAVQKCNPEIVRALLALKATNLTVHNNDGNTAEDQLVLTTEKAKTINWNKVCMMMSKALTDKSTLLAQTYTRHTSLIAILIATITFVTAFTLPGGYSSDSRSEGLPIMAGKIAIRVFLISDTLALCSSLAVAFMKKLMGVAYMTTTVAFATGLYIVVAPRILWLAILICKCLLVIYFLQNCLVDGLY